MSYIYKVSIIHFTNSESTLEYQLLMYWYPSYSPKKAKAYVPCAFILPYCSYSALLMVNKCSSGSRLCICVSALQKHVSSGICDHSSISASGGPSSTAVIPNTDKFSITNGDKQEYIKWIIKVTRNKRKIINFKFIVVFYMFKTQM